MAKPRYNVLIVDDRQEDHDLYTSYLKRDRATDYMLFHAYTGEEGLRQYRTNKIDCILLDNSMPRMTGLDMLQELAGEKKPVPVIMLTGEGNENIAVSAMKLGSQDYIPKRSINAAALKRAIANAAGRTAIQKELENARQALIQSNRDLEQFATIAAHDLKAPLRAVIQHLSLVEQNMRGKIDADSQSSINFAVCGATRMRQLVDGLYDYAKFGFSPSIHGPVDCNAQFDTAVKTLETDIRDKNAGVTRGNLPWVQGDAVQIQQLLQNLIGNALKYTAAEPHIHVSAERDGATWRFSVADNGIGIAPEHQDKIFLIFRRLHGPNEYSGAGVGLAICKRVVQNHGGRIWVESTPGKGSTFFFTLPEAVAERAPLAVVA